MANRKDSSKRPTDLVGRGYIEKSKPTTEIKTEQTRSMPVAEIKTSQQSKDVNKGTSADKTKKR